MVEGGRVPGEVAGLWSGLLEERKELRFYSSRIVEEEAAGPLWVTAGRTQQPLLSSSTPLESIGVFPTSGTFPNPWVLWDPTYKWEERQESSKLIVVCIAMGYWLVTDHGVLTLIKRRPTPSTSAFMPLTRNEWLESRQVPVKASECVLLVVAPHS